tara:strand:+ start:252 stop:965 length:714 start_codon:yes stop_codon:yes gene_type:complete
MKLIILILSIFDYINKKKILNFFKLRLSYIYTIIDVGGHKGETFDLFDKNFKIENYYAFEASPINFKFLEKKKIKANKKNFKVFNNAVGDNVNEVDFYQLDESSSSTLNEINENSNYYKKKNFLINFLSFKKPKTIKFKVKPILLSEFIKSNNITKVEILKIDTEGYEYRVIKGLKDKISMIDYIYFEHHYDDMIKKGYTYSMIHSYLKKNGFEKIFKLKMFFRKSFEYVYKNTNLN